MWSRRNVRRASSQRRTRETFTLACSTQRSSIRCLLYIPAIIIFINYMHILLFQLWLYNKYENKIDPGHRLEQHRSEGK